MPHQRRLNAEIIFGLAIGFGVLLAQLNSIFNNPPFVLAINTPHRLGEFTRLVDNTQNSIPGNKRFGFLWRHIKYETYNIGRLRDAQFTAQRQDMPYSNNLSSNMDISEDSLNLTTHLAAINDTNSPESPVRNNFSRDRIPCSTTAVVKPSFGSPMSIIESVYNTNTMEISNAELKGDALERYVKAHGGKDKPIRRILIANNGMAATKAIASMKQWAFETLGDEDIIEFVVMATPEDLAANAEFLRKAGKIVHVPGGPNRNNYANVDLICQIAKQEQVDAVWPGWGHASENPRLPETLSAMDIRFIGPSSKVMAALGDKIAANILAQSAGVPSIPWSGDGIKIANAKDGVIPSELFQKATVNNVDECYAVCKRIGFPVMIKASEGGGGKGIRMVNSLEEVKAAYEQVCNEVVGSPVFIMKLCTGARHIEVQIVGDTSGNAVALSGRDCSTQRRFQKIFEEAPPTTIVPKPIFREMELAAQRLTRSLGYVGAGTVEYLFDAKTKAFYFLELNPRLQVEHPVTEGVTNVNLPAAQLQVAMGIPLDRIPDIRAFFGKDVNTSDPIDFMKETYPDLTNHVIAARITAENPDEGFKPTSGRIERLDFNPPKDVWGYFSVSANGSVHDYADSQIGHIFAQGRTRNDARKRLITGLRSVFVDGQIRTPVEVLQQLLEKPEFIDNTLDTSWLDGLIKNKILLQSKSHNKAILSAALFRAIKSFEENWESLLGTLERGYHYISDLDKVLTCSHEIIYGGIRYMFTAVKTGRNRLSIRLNDQVYHCSYSAQSDGSYIATINDILVRLRGREEPMGLRLLVDGSTTFIPTVHDPSELRSDVTGKLVRFLVTPGSVVKKGEPYAEVEAMKMIMTLTAGGTGKITPHKSGGSLITAGDILATLELDDAKDSTAGKIETFSGKFEWTNSEKSVVPKANIDSASAAERLSLCLKGYTENSKIAAALVEHLKDGYTAALKDTENKSSASDSAIEVGKILQRLLDEYTMVEEAFSGRNAKEALELLDNSKKTKDEMANYLVAHSKLQERNEILCELVKTIKSISHLWSLVQNAALDPEKKNSSDANETSIGSSLLKSLHSIANLAGKEYGSVCFAARSLLQDAYTPPMLQRVNNLKKLLLEAGEGSQSKITLEGLSWLPSIQGGLDLLSQLFGDKEVGLKAMEVCVRRHYRGFNIHNVQRKVTNGIPLVMWEYSAPIESDKIQSRRGSPKRQNGGTMRKGIFALFSSVDAVVSAAPTLLQHVEAAANAAAVEQAAHKHTHGLVDEQSSAEVLPPMNEFFVALPPQQSCEPGSASEASVVSAFNSIFHEKLFDALHRARIALASVHIPQANGHCRRFSYKEKDAYVECTSDRDLCPAIPILTALEDLKTYFDVSRLTSFTHDTFIYLGTPKPYQDSTTRFSENTMTMDASADSKATGVKQNSSDTRANATRSSPPNTRSTEQVIFVRSAVFNPSVCSDSEKLFNLMNQQLEELDNALKNPHITPTASGRLYLHVVPPFQMPVAQVREIFSGALDLLKEKHSDSLLRLGVDEIQFKFHSQGDNVKQMAYSLIAATTKGGWLRLIDTLGAKHNAFMPDQMEYMQKSGPFSDSESYTSTTTSDTSQMPTPRQGFFRGHPQYPNEVSAGIRGATDAMQDMMAPQGTRILTRIDAKRAIARRAGSTYIYDFLGLLEAALQQVWREDSGPNSKLSLSNIMEVSEFHMNSAGELLLEPGWVIGDNKVGMVGFLIKIKTPEYPEGRTIVILGNDITHQGGSFGVQEHKFYAKVSEYARLQGVPRIYIACNSGARIGLYDTLKDKIRIKWKDANNISLGPDYLYLTSDVYEQLPEGVVDGHWTSLEEGDDHNKRVFVLDAIIGEPHQHLGVENLRGSGLIAGETSRAYDDTFTLSYVSGRTVGIGAYVVRLGQRIIQMKNGPLLLTGYQALNKLLGREVYHSQDQLGGPEIMHKNGVSHLVVDNDKEGMVQILKWLSYVPPTAKEYSQHRQSSDPVERDVDFVPTSSVYDPRCMLAGCDSADSGNFMTGILDKDSFKEYLAGWGKSVVVGRGKLGGIPVGVIAVETRTTESSQPADPANPNSKRVTTQQAGQVWFPDSAFKTAQAIRDFDRGENLPLLIFANWRGFSGGTRDMYNEVLKFGALIVDALRVYKHPVFVYIPPFGELRGGSWAVIDPTINPNKMEMYADVNSRGGVLEPPGICEIKFRQNVQKALMKKIDPVLNQLESELQKAKADQVSEIKAQIAKREELLSPLYTQVAHLYADLHDRAPRMKARGGVRRIIDFKRSRSFLYWRIRRRLAADQIIERLRAANPKLSWQEAQDILDRILLKPAEIDVDDDKCVSLFLSSQQGRDAIESLVAQSGVEGTQLRVNELIQKLPDTTRKSAMERS